MQLHEEQHSKDHITPQTQSLEKVSNDSPFVYKLSEPIGAKSPIFATSLKTCGVKKDANSLSLARQLFSGLTDIRVDNKDRLTLASHSVPIRSARGFLDGQEVFLKSVTLPNADCIMDFVAWSTDQQGLSDHSSIVMDLLYNSTILSK